MNASSITILQAIHEKYEATTSLKDLTPGGLWTNEIPEGSFGSVRDFPFASVELLDTEYEYTISENHSHIEKSRFLLSVFNISAVDVERALNLFLAKFNLPSLNFNNTANDDSLMDVYPLRRGMYDIPKRDKNSETVTQGWAEFEAWIWRDTPTNFSRS